MYRKIDGKLHRKSIRRRIVRYSLLGFNAVLLFGIAAFVLFNQRSSGETAKSSVVRNSAIAAAATSSDRSVANPLDQISSADIASNVARMSALSESVSVANQAASVSLELSVAPATSSIVSKPQVVSTALPSKKDIKTYIAVAGDDVPAIATKFNVTSDSIKWSNNLSSNVVTVGQTLSIPPAGVSGLVYIVKAGDTPASLAAKYKANVEEITAFNDAELTPLKVGERIIIPGGSIAPPVVAAVRSTATGFAFGTAPIYGNNAYAYGYCTWYVAGRIAVPSNWGNANTWDNGAAISGWTVSSVPRVGAIGQTDRGAEGHVAVVEAVSADGTMIKYADMNGLAGWGREGRTPDFVSAAKFEHYIYQ